MWNRKRKVALCNTTASHGNRGLQKVQLALGRDTATNILALQKNGIRFLVCSGQYPVLHLMIKEECMNIKCIS